MSTIISMGLGDYDFEPIPQLTYSRTISRTPSGAPIGCTNTVELTGYLSSLNGCANLYNLDQQKRDLMSAISCCSGCAHFTLICGDSGVIYDDYVRVTSLQFSPSQDNWTQTIPYQISLAWDSNDEGCPACITDKSETWNITHLADSNECALCPSGSAPTYLEISHELRASAHDCCYSGGMTPGWEVARDWVLEKLGEDQDAVSHSGVFSFNPANLNYYNHSRVLNYSPEAGSYSVNETWVAVDGTLVAPCIEEYTIEETFTDSQRIKQYTISGSIAGLDTRNANFQLTQTKCAAADAYWSYVQPILPQRIQCTNGLSSCRLNPVPVSSSVLRNKKTGIINYNYVYSNKVPTLVSNAISENISIVDTRPTSVVGRVPILGREAGPLIFSCNSSNETTRAVNIAVVTAELPCLSGTPCEIFEAMLADASGVHASIETFLCCIENDLTSRYSKVYRIGDTGNSDILNGVFSREVSWLYQDCDSPGVLPFCEE